MNLDEMFDEKLFKKENRAMDYEEVRNVKEKIYNSKESKNVEGETLRRRMRYSRIGENYIKEE